MKNLFNAFCLLMLVGAFALLGVYQSKGTEQPKELKKLDTAQIINSVQSVNSVVKTELYLDSTTFGVCDTCRTSFIAVVKDNRQYADSLLKENLVLYQNIIDTKALNDTAIKYKNKLMLEIQRTKALLKKK